MHKTKTQTISGALSNVVIAHFVCLFLLFKHLNESIVGFANTKLKMLLWTIKTHFAPQLQTTNGDRDHNRTSTKRKVMQRRLAALSACSLPKKEKLLDFDENLKKFDLWCGNLCSDMEIYLNCTHKLIIIPNRSQREKKAFDMKNGNFWLLVYLNNKIRSLCISHLDLIAV